MSESLLVRAMYILKLIFKYQGLCSLVCNEEQIILVCMKVVLIGVQIERLGFFNFVDVFGKSVIMADGSCDTCV